MQNSTSSQAFPSGQATQTPVLPFPLLSQVLTGAAQATDQAEIYALLHSLLQVFNDLQLRVGQLEHTEHIRTALRPRRDLGIDY